MIKKRWGVLVAALLSATGPVLAATPQEIAKGTKAGVYITYDELQASGNAADNVCLTSDGNGGWTTEATLKWKDRSSTAIFYCYAPYRPNIVDPYRIPVTFNADQRTAEAQAANEFYYGRMWTSPDNGQPRLSLERQFSRVIVKLVAGEGLTESEMEEAVSSVRLKKVSTEAYFNLKEGFYNYYKTTDVVMMAEGNLTFSAVMMPQRMNNLAVTWDNQEYVVAIDRDCGNAKIYTITVTLKKKSGGMDISIGDWEDAGEDFGGTVN